jgi:hypothetical protein
VRSTTLASALTILLVAREALADDPSCAQRTARARVSFGNRGPVDFGPGFSGSLGGSALGLRYNFLLLGSYDWSMNGALAVRWPPALLVGAVGDANGGRLAVQYGLRLQFWLRLFGTELAIPVPVEVGVDRGELGVRTFTPWAWDGMSTAVTLVAHERLLRHDSVTFSGQLIDYDVYAQYEMTTSVRTREITFPQAMTSITETNPEARVPPTANGAMDMPARWLGSLRYVGAVRLRFVFTFRTPLCVPGTPLCLMGTQSLSPDPIPFASATEQQLSVDRSVRLQLPGLSAEPGAAVDFGRVRLGLQARQVVTLRNPGTETVVVTPAAPEDAHFQVATEPLCIASGAARQVSVRFTPDAVGMAETDLVLASSAPGVPDVRLRLRGEAVDDGAPLPDAGAREDAPSQGDASGVQGDAGPTTLLEDPGPGGCTCRAPRGAITAGPLAAFAALVLRRRARGRRAQR